jgi:hypothetical protein
MFSGVFAMHDRCPRCGHQFEREPGFFQGAMYVSYVLGVALFSLLAIFAEFVLAPRMGLSSALGLAVFTYMAGVPVLFRYSRVIWSHANIGTLDAAARGGRDRE